MDSLTKEENLVEIRDNFSEIIVSEIPVLMWQLKEDGSRLLQPIYIKDMLGDDQLLIKAATGKSFQLKQQTVYFHIATHKLIFKTEIDTIENKLAYVKFPKILKFTELSTSDSDEISSGLEEYTDFLEDQGLGSHIDDIMRVAGEGRANKNREDLLLEEKRIKSTILENHMRLDTYNATEKINTKWKMKSMSSHDTEILQSELIFISLEEEDEIFAEQRESVRAKPKQSKLITIQKSDLAVEEQIYPLYDLSKGGLSFLITEEDLFTKGEVILVNALDAKRFDTPMQVTVMVVRAADELGVQFKVGCAFVSGD
jgi:hypothetical protein